MARTPRVAAAGLFVTLLALAADAPRPGGPQFRCRATKLDNRSQCTALAIGPDGCLYVSDVHGTIRRHYLTADGRTDRAEVAATLEGQRISHFCFDPRASAHRLVLWVSHARRRAGPWAGVVTRLALPATGAPDVVQRTDYVVGLPCPPGLEHQPNGLAFGPDGRMYQAIGGVTTLGGDPNWGAPESRLSAAVLTIDVRGLRFGDAKLPLDVRAVPPVSYDPATSDAAVKVYATGLRNARRLCWHSNGHLYAATNGNSIGGTVKTPAGPGVPAVNARPHAFLTRVVEGKYYGHPNPARGQYVLNGGNPTPGPDPWEVPEYPVGVKPDPNFDPSLLHDLRPGGGTSCTGLAEYTAAGPLQGRLLVAYSSGGRYVQTFAFDKDGHVTDERPLVGPDGAPLRFAGPLDVVVHPGTGRIYVVAFGDRVGGGGAVTGGGLWLLEPITE